MKPVAVRGGMWRAAIAATVISLVLFCEPWGSNNAGGAEEVGVHGGRCSSCLVRRAAAEMAMETAAAGAAADEVLPQGDGFNRDINDDADADADAASDAGAWLEGWWVADGPAVWSGLEAALSHQGLPLPANLISFPAIPNLPDSKLLQIPFDAFGSAVAADQSRPPSLAAHGATAEEGGLGQQHAIGFEKPGVGQRRSLPSRRGLPDIVVDEVQGSEGPQLLQSLMRGSKLVAQTRNEKSRYEAPPRGVPPTSGWGSFLGIRHASFQAPVAFATRRRWGRVLQDDSYEIDAAIKAPPAPAPPLTVLAAARTRRIDPAQGFNIYTDGWQVTVANYYWSLLWAAIYGPIAGIVWVIIGLSFVVFLGCFWLCFRGRWREMREQTFYEKKQLLLPIIFTVLAVVIACIGYGLLTAGTVRLQDNVHDIMDFTTQELESFVGTLYNVSDVFRQIANLTSFGVPIPSNVQTNLLNAASKIDAEVAQKKQLYYDESNKVTNVVNIMTIVLLVLSSVIVLIILAALICGLLKFVVASNILVVFVWFFVLVTAVLIGIFYLIYLYTGDTYVAMTQVTSTNPPNNALNKFLQCVNVDRVNVTETVARYAGYQITTRLNATLMGKYAEQMQQLGLEDGICNPFGGPPDYSYDSTKCFGAETVETLLTAIESFQCSTPGAATPPPQPPFSSNLTTACAIVQQLPPEATALLTEMRNITRNVVGIIADLAMYKSCAFVVDVAQFVLRQINSLESNSLETWLGFLIVSVGSAVFCICLPIYVFRAVRPATSDASSLEEWKEGPFVPSSGSSLSFGNGRQLSPRRDGGLHMGSIRESRREESSSLVDDGTAESPFSKVPLQDDGRSDGSNSGRLWEATR